MESCGAEPGQQQRQGDSTCLGNNHECDGDRAQEATESGGNGAATTTFTFATRAYTRVGDDNIKTCMW